MTESTGTYRHTEEYRVRYDDLDTYRHLNNKSFITFVEDARGRYLTAATGFVHHGDDSVGVMIVRFSIDFRRQVHDREAVVVHTRCSNIGGKSLTLRHLLTVNDATVAEAESILVTYAPHTQATIPVPERFRTAIRDYESAVKPQR